MYIENTNNDFIKVVFGGKRDIKAVIRNWLELKNIVTNTEKILIVDSMTGELSIEGIIMLIEMLSEHDYYLRNKIAVILTDNDSYYNTRFFDLFAKHWGLNIKHFNNEAEAELWFNSIR